MNRNIFRMFARVAFTVMVILTWMIFPFKAVAQNESWGKRPYREEVKHYRELVEQYEREYRKLELQERAIDNDLQAFWAEWSLEDRSKGREWFKTSEYLSPNLQADKEWTESEKREAGQRYTELENQYWAIDIESDDLVSRHARDDLWSAHLEWLRKRNKAKGVQVLYRGIELQAIKAYEGIYGTEFIYDCLDDMQYILKDYVSNLTDELYNCFLSSATLYAKNSMLRRELPTVGGGFGQITWGEWTLNCVKGITLNAIVNALEAAVRKQFVDKMENKGIEPQVAEYWWSEIVMPKAAKQSRFDQAFKQFLTGKFWKGQLKAELTRNLHKRLADDLKPALVKRLKTLAREDRYGPNARKLVEKVAKDRAAKHTAMQFLEAAEFTVSYTERAALLFYNQAGFEEIAANELAKYKFIKDCLVKKGRPAHATAIIGVFKYSEAGYRDFVRDCKQKPLVRHRFNYPTWQGYRLDWCHTWGVGCGGDAANALCVRKWATKGL